MVEGKKVVSSELVDIFAASEGSINLYYGMIGNGKTYNATADILDLLIQGKVVYCNWHINVDDFDDRKSLLQLFAGLILPWKKIYYRIPCKENLYYFDPDTFESVPDLVEFLSKLNDCHIFFDEGQDMFDSYEGTRFSKLKRRLILHTRHYHRTLNIITQRPTAIQVSARGNVNRFYKCVKLLSWPFVVFGRLEYQEMTNETVDETKPYISRKIYKASNRVFRAYNTSYLSQGIPKSQTVNFEAYVLTYKDKIANIISVFRQFFANLKVRKNESNKSEQPLGVKRVEAALKKVYQGGPNSYTSDIKQEQAKLPF